MTIDPADLAERLRGTLADLLGIRFVEMDADRVVAELPVRDALTTVGGAVHGGTLMALADTVGAVATVLNLPPGATTVTLESKTNFLAAGRGGTVRAEATCLPSGTADHGLADAGHGRGRATALPHHPDADGAARGVRAAGGPPPRRRRRRVEEGDRRLERRPVNLPSAARRRIGLIILR